MFTMPSYLSVLKGLEKQAWCIRAPASCVYVLIGVVCAAMALPFGLKAAALAPVAVGFAKAIFEHYAKGDADPANFAWIIAGAVQVIGFVKLAGLA